jgi:hypothetical protein
MRRHLHRAILGGLLGATFLAGFPAEAAVVVSTKPTAHMSCVAGICTATAANAVLNVTDLDNLLASGSATVSTGGATASDIDIAAALTWASGNSLTLDAYRSLIVTHPVAASGSGGLTILTNDGGTGGVLSFQGAGHIGFLGLTNALSINGASYKLESDIASLASDIAANASGNYALAASYNASSDGVYSTSPISTWFTGNFEGLGNSITHLKINDNGDENVGLFAVVAGGHVSDINIVNARIEASSSAPSSVGILVGTLIGAVNGTTKGSGVGGTISGAVTSGTVQVKSGTQADAGGLVGQIGSYGAGYQTALVVNSQTSATVTTNVGYAGGLLGEDDGTSAVVTSFATGQVTAKDGFAGGLVGFDGGSVLNSYATGNATIGPAAHFKPKCSVGGLLGISDGTSYTDVQYSYSTGTAIGGTGAYAGGFYGSGGGTNTSNYWDTTTSANTVASGDSNGQVVATGLTTSQFQSSLPSGFSSSVWKEDSTINGGLPYLFDNPPAP